MTQKLFESKVELKTEQEQERQTKSLGTKAANGTQGVGRKTTGMERKTADIERGANKEAE